MVYLDKFTFLLNGVVVNSPVEWSDIEVNCIFDTNLQPNINIDEFTFVGKSLRIIDEWINAKSMLEGCPFVINYDTYNLFDGCLDFVGGFVKMPYKYKIKVKQTNGINQVDERLKSLTYGYVASQGNISKNDYVKVPVIIKKKFDATEVALISISLYVVTKEVHETFSKDKEFVAKNIKIIISAPTQKPAEVFFAIFTTLLFIAFKVFMLIAILKMIQQIKQNLMGRLTHYKGITLKRALEIASSFVGYEFQSSIPELDYYVYLPSKQDDKVKENRDDEGIPNTSDFGYRLDEMFELCMKLFNAKPNIYSENGKNIIQLESESSEVYQSQSSYVMPSVLTETFRYNLDDFKANTFISFLYDPTDEYSMPNSRSISYDSKAKNNEKIELEKGTAYEVQLDIVTDKPLNKLNKGLDDISIPMSLGHRRNKLSALEYGLKALFFTTDQLIKLFGGQTIGEKIDEHKGALLLSAPSFNNPKLICLVNGVIPSNHRDLLSARALFNKYHWYKSFKRNPDKTQCEVYENITIPFTFRDFVTTIKNSYFTTPDGRKGKFLSYNWQIGSDKAVATFEIENQYLSNLNETIIES